MIDKRVLSLGLVLMVALSVVMIAPAGAQPSPSWTIVSVRSTGCDEWESGFETLVDGIVYGDPYYYDTIVEQSGDIYMAQREFGDSWGPTETLNWGLASDDDLGMETGTWPMQPGVPIRVTIMLRDAQLTLLDTDELYPYYCAGAPVEDVTEDVVPGCDVQVNIPSTAVVGLFVADAPVHWTPGALTSPVVIIEAGKTAWVLGMDASGAYYQVLWHCQFLWVPVGTMGPNPDDVWQNTPLPMGVVD